MKRRAASLALACAVAAWTAADVSALASLPAAAPGDRPSWLPEAVALGSTKAKLDVYRTSDLAVEYTTPFLRVARAANKIAREGRAPRGADIEPKAWVPELRVLIGVLPVTDQGPRALAAPKSARLILGAGEVQPTRMELGTEKQMVAFSGSGPEQVSAGVLKAVFAVPGKAPPGAELEIRYAWTRDGREQEIVKRVSLDFRKTRW